MYLAKPGGNKISFKSSNLRHFGQVTAKHLVSGSSLNYSVPVYAFLTSVNQCSRTCALGKFVRL